MSGFDLVGFIAEPSLVVLNHCRKDQLLQIANHLDISLLTIIKKKLRTLIVDKMVELGHMLLAAKPEMGVLGGAAAGESLSPKKGKAPGGESAYGRVSDEEGGRPKTPFTLSQFDALSDNGDESRRD